MIPIPPELFRFNLLEDQKDKVYFISTRQGGISKGAYGIFNLGLNTLDIPGNNKASDPHLLKWPPHVTFKQDSRFQNLKFH